MILFRNKLNDDETCVLSLSLKQSFKTDEDNFKIHFLASGKSFKFITFNNEAVLRISSTPLKGNGKCRIIFLFNVPSLGTRILIFEVQLIEEGQVMFRYMERLTEKQHGKLFVLNLEDAENNTYSTAFICGVEFTLRQRCVIDIGNDKT